MIYLILKTISNTSPRCSTVQACHRVFVLRGACRDLVSPCAPFHPESEDYIVNSDAKNNNSWNWMGKMNLPIGCGFLVAPVYSRALVMRQCTWTGHVFHPVSSGPPTETIRAKLWLLPYDFTTWNDNTAIGAEQFASSWSLASWSVEPDGEGYTEQNSPNVC